MAEGTSRSAVLVELTESSVGAPVHASVGQSVHLTLSETPTTGYRWKLSDACASHLALQHDTANPAGSTPGAPGSHAWTFVATAPGDCRLVVASGRAWEKGPPTGRSLSFDLHITP